MQLPNLNNIQRIIFIIAAIVLFAYQVESEETDSMLLTTILSVVFLVIAFSGNIKILIPAIVKTIAVFVLIVSLIINASQYISYSESRGFSADNARLREQLETYIAASNEDRETIARLTTQNENLKKLWR